MWSGPQEVKIVNKDYLKRDTTIAIIKFEPNNLTVNREDSLKGDSSRGSIVYKLDPILVDSMIRIVLSEQSRPRNALVQLPTKSFENNGLLIAEEFATFNRPKFELPTIITGYSNSPVDHFGSIDINKNEFSRSEPIDLMINFIEPDAIGKITPIFVDVVKRKSEKEVYQVWTDQFKPTRKNTKVRFLASFPPDNYEINIGWYYIEGLHQPYPTFFNKTFKVIIKQ